VEGQEKNPTFFLQQPNSSRHRRRHVEKRPHHFGLHPADRGHLGLSDLPHLPNGPAAMGEEEGHEQNSIQAHPVHFLAHYKNYKNLLSLSPGKWAHLTGLGSML
jgi:hypothetical protein